MENYPVKRLCGDVSSSLLPLFPDIRDMALLCALEGRMGAVYALGPEPGRAVCACLGGFYYFGGDADLPAAAAFLRTLPAGAHLVSLEKAWQDAFVRALGDQMQAEPRHMLSPDMDALKEAHLLDICRSLPAGFRLERLSGALFDRALALDWARGYVAQYETRAAYEAQGFGFAVTNEGKLCCIAPAFCVCSRGIEVGIATDPAFRRQGLAAAAAARLVLECKARQLIANWDSGNPLSLRLARRLGYRPGQDYTAFCVQ